MVSDNLWCLQFFNYYTLFGKSFQVFSSFCFFFFFKYFILAFNTEKMPQTIFTRCNTFFLETYSYFYSSTLIFPEATEINDSQQQWGKSDNHHQKFHNVFVFCAGRDESIKKCNFIKCDRWFVGDGIFLL